MPVELDPSTQATLSRGARLVATLNQPQYSPWSVGEQVAALFAATEGYLDDLEVSDVSRFNNELRERVQNAGLADKVETQGKLDDDLKKELKDLIETFKKDFSPTETA